MHVQLTSLQKIIINNIIHYIHRTSFPYLHPSSSHTELPWRLNLIYIIVLGPTPKRSWVHIFQTWDIWGSWSFSPSLTTYTILSPFLLPLTLPHNNFKMTQHFRYIRKKQQFKIQVRLKIYFLDSISPQLHLITREWNWCHPPKSSKRLEASIP